MSADVAILIVTHNSQAHILDCLGSVYRQRETVSQQVIVVDNASSDGTTALIAQHFPGTQVVVAGRNLGFAAGVNLAARHADAKFFLLLNPDAVILEHAVDRVVEFARSQTEFTLIGGRALRADGSVEPSSCWGAPTLWSLTAFALGLSTVARQNRLLDPESLGRWPRDTASEVGFVSGCFLLVPATVWRELGGFDERYFMYAEDADLAARARAAGYRSGICPAARVRHEIGRSSSTPSEKAFLLYRGKATYVRCHWSGARRRLGLLLLVTGVWLRACVWHIAKVANSGSQAPWRDLWEHRRRWITGYSLRDSATRAVMPHL